ncbi:hypothetical protein V6Z11_D04G037600 [Gossypium hirsutum]
MLLLLIVASNKTWQIASHFFVLIRSIYCYCFPFPVLAFSQRSSTMRHCETVLHSLNGGIPPIKMIPIYHSFSISSIIWFGLTMSYKYCISQADFWSLDD